MNLSLLPLPTIVFWKLMMSFEVRHFYTLYIYELGTSIGSLQLHSGVLFCFVDDYGGAWPSMDSGSHSTESASQHRSNFRSERRTPSQTSSRESGEIYHKHQPQSTGWKRSRRYNVTCKTRQYHQPSQSSSANKPQAPSLLNMPPIHPATPPIKPFPEHVREAVQSRIEWHISGGRVSYCNPNIAVSRMTQQFLSQHGKEHGSQQVLSFTPHVLNSVRTFVDGIIYAKPENFLDI